MKYRIKETIDGNDVSTFTVQYKLFWWWENCIQRPSKHEAENFIRNLQTKAVKYHTTPDSIRADIEAKNKELETLKETDYVAWLKIKNDC